jgi:hypothetical protein
MISLVAALLVLGIGWWTLKQFSRADPAALARLMKRACGAVALVLAGFLMLRGRFDMAMLAGGVAVWLFGWSYPGLPGFGSSSRRPGSASRVRSSVLEMVLDHDSGALTGTVLSGPLAGRALDELDAPELERLRDLCATADPDGGRLLEAYLDRRFPGRREHAHRDRDARARADAQPGPMTEQEAYEVLGLQPGASMDAVRAAHRALMKKLHPDQGGSTYLATRVNQAKDLLTNRHR